MFVPLSEDPEARASRFVSALDGLSALLSGQLPDLPIGSDNLQGLISLLAEEAHAVVPSFEVGPRAVND